MTFGALFAGIGGIDLGLERAGFVCRWQIEIDPFCNRVLEKHWPGVKRYGDIRTVTGYELEPVDLICGGFPCQDLSQAGKRAGIEGTRSSLWFEFARLVGKLRPRYVLVENVPGLLVYDGIRRVIGELARCGYVGLWRSLRASEFGAAHLRKRVFIVAYREHEGRGISSTPLHHNGRNASGYDVNGCNQDLAHAATTRRDRRPRQELRIFGPSLQPARFDNGGGGLADAGVTALPDAKQTELSGPQRDVERRAAAELCGTPLPFAPGPADSRWPAILRARPDLAPALEPPICRMVDGIPDWLDGALSNRTKRLGRLGNAVVPQIAEWIGRRILAANLEKGGTR